MVFGADSFSLIRRSCLVTLLVSLGVVLVSSLDRGTSSPSGCSSWSESFGYLIVEGFFFLIGITIGDFFFFVGVSGAFS